MTTQAQLAANRRNAQKSTGPRTPEGKARVSLNAPRNANGHGLRAQATLDALQRTPLFDDDPQEFATFVRTMVDHFHPEGPLEEWCVEDIAINQWSFGEGRRVAIAETGYIASAQRLVLEGPGRDNARLHARSALPDFEVVEKLDRYETSIRRQLNRSLDTLARLQDRRQEMRSSSAPVYDMETAPPARAQLPNEPNSPAGQMMDETATSVQQSQILPDLPDAEARNGDGAPQVVGAPAENSNSHERSQFTIPGLDACSP
jgi:hypothetical protein